VSAPVLGVDLGGTKVAVASMRDRRLTHAALELTDCTSGAALIDQIVSLIQQHRGPELGAVGVGVPSVVEFDTGRVVSSVNIPLKDVPLRQVLGERVGVPVFVDNDATVAALAEAHDEQLRLVARDLVILTVGTGVGGGLVLGGRIYRGATGGAGELGHTIIGLNLNGDVPPPTGFPTPGSLEYEAAGHALDRLAAEAATRHPDSALGRIRARGEPVLGPDAVEAAQSGDPDARRLVELWGERLGIGIANAINTFDPEEVVIGGGGAQAGSLLLEPACRVARAYVLPGLGGRTTIRLARHGVGAGVLGAALLAQQELEAAESHEPTARVRSGPASDAAPDTSTDDAPDPASDHSTTEVRP
jgi:glucokinase